MKKSLTTNLLAGLILAITVSMTGCAAGGGGLLSSSSAAPTFPESNLDYSSHLDQLQARGEQSPYVPAGGFSDGPSRGPLFSLGSGSRGPVRSGSC